MKKLFKKGDRVNFDPTTPRTKPRKPQPGTVLEDTDPDEPLEFTWVRYDNSDYHRSCTKTACLTLIEKKDDDDFGDIADRVHAEYLAEKDD